MFDKFFNTVYKGLDYFIFFHTSFGKSAPEQHAEAVASRNSEIGFTRLAGTVDHSSHNGYVHVFAVGVDVLDSRLKL